MKNIIFWFVFGAMPFLLFGQKNGNKPILDGTIGVDQGHQKPTILYFFSDWCLPCSWIEENALSIDSVESRIDEVYSLQEINIEDKENLNIIRHFRVKSIPTLIILDRNGTPIKRIETSLNAHQLYHLLKETDSIVQDQIKDNRIDKPTYVINPSGQISRPPLKPKQESIIETKESYVSEEAIQPTNESFTYSLDNLPPQNIYNDDVAPRSTQLYTINLGDYTDYQKAISTISKLERKLNSKVSIKTVQNNNLMSYHLHFGKFNSFAKAQEQLKTFEGLGIRGMIEIL